MLTDEAQKIITYAKNWAFTQGLDHLTPKSFMVALTADIEGRLRLSECFSCEDIFSIFTATPDYEITRLSHGQMEVSPKGKSILVQAQNLAGVNGVPDRRHPGLINVAHFCCAAAMSWDVCTLLKEKAPIDREKSIQLLYLWDDEDNGPDRLSNLMGRLRQLRKKLKEKIYGQDHAIYAFFEGLYEAQLSGGSTTEQKAPSAVFVFAGPPGVGKTYTAEQAAMFLERPFKRYDMTAYSDHQAHNQLVGFSSIYKNAQEGLLTGYVKQNPQAILLFDEIEKAHLNTIQLFYQILDLGCLEDKFNETQVCFGQTIIIFTTNAGRMLYDNINRSGMVSIGSDYHRETILSALENEINPANGLAVFPPALCSRLSQGVPVVFNYLRINELALVSENALKQTAVSLERQYFKRIEYDDRIPITLVLNAGYRVDARQVRSNSSRFLKKGLLSFASSYEENRLEEVLKPIKKFHFSLDHKELNEKQDIRKLYEPTKQQTVLLIENESIAQVYTAAFSSINWHVTSHLKEALEIIALNNIDLILIDLWVSNIENKAGAVTENTLDGKRDYKPFSARAIKHGRIILHSIRCQFPEMPVYLLSVCDPENVQKKCDSRNISSAQDTYKKVLSGNRFIDEELFYECFRAGGARGVLHTMLEPGNIYREEQLNFANKLDKILKNLYCESQARHLVRERKSLAYELVCRIDEKHEKAVIHLRNFRLQRVVNAKDVSELLSDIERPSTTFDNVYGAYSAKKSCRFIIDWLKRNKHYAALGVRPPKGILLEGLPGTGKTMLARAVAGESECAFIKKSATSFITVWQGSGPQNVRELFERARRYAPSIVFIDEIDAIGVIRNGGFNRSSEETLNALLIELDGFSDHSNQPVIVIAATNIAESLDPALKRRFDRILNLEMPDRNARLAYITDAIKQRKDAAIDQNILDRIAKQSAGMTIADLEHTIQEACVMAVQIDKILSTAILEEAFEKIRFGEKQKIPDKATLERIARHEAGHTLISFIGGHIPLQVTIVGRGGAGGYMEPEIDEDKIFYTKSELEQRICECMGGRAAEIIYYGEIKGLSSGISGDLADATYWAQKMVKEFGMSEDFEFVSLSDHNQNADGPIALKIIEISQSIIKTQYKHAIGLLIKNKKKLDDLSKALFEENRLTRFEIKKIFED